MEGCLENWQGLFLQVVKKSDERPTLRSVANAIRTGIFIEKIYRRMSKSQMMAIPEAVEQRLQVNIFISNNKKQPCYFSCLSSLFK